MERVLADCLEASRVPRDGIRTEQPYPVFDGLRRRWDQRRWCDFLFFLVPDRNGDRVIGKLSRGNKFPNNFLETSRWLELLHKNILEAGQYFCYSAPPPELLQGGRNTWCRFSG